MGRGWTQPGGRPHAEADALARAGKAARESTAYVTLEPCAHWGRTPPCADALVQAGIGRAVVAIEDPDPRTSGTGIGRMRDAGVAVTVGVESAAAAEVAAGFLLRVRQGRPLFTLKVATSLDGAIAATGGASRWVTGEGARARGHLLRANHDAIMIGVGTAIADDPLLTVRIGRMRGRSPLRIVVDARLDLPPESALARSAQDYPLWVATGNAVDRDRAERLERLGIRILRLPLDYTGRVSLPHLARALGRAGLTRVLVEGGGRLSAGLFRARLVDRVTWFRAPLILGGDGVAAVASIDAGSPAEGVELRHVDTMPVDRDVLETYVPVYGEGAKPETGNADAAHERH